MSFVFAIKDRKMVIGSEWEEELHKYITGIVKNNGPKLLAVEPMPDPLHLDTFFNVCWTINR